MFIMFVIWAVLLGGIFTFITCLLARKFDTVTKFCAKVIGGKAVCLKSSFGTSYRTVAKKDSFGDLQAPVYFGTGVGSVILEDGGAIYEHSESSYINKWIEIK